MDINWRKKPGIHCYWFLKRHLIKRIYNNENELLTKFNNAIVPFLSHLQMDQGQRTHTETRIQNIIEIHMFWLHAELFSCSHMNRNSQINPEICRITLSSRICFYKYSNRNSPESFTLILKSIR